MKYEVPVENLNKVLTYLATRPFNEVAAIIPLLQTPQVTPVAEASDEEAK